MSEPRAHTASWALPALSALSALALLVGCTQSPSAPAPGQRATAAAQPLRTAAEQRLPWGDGEHALSHARGGFEQAPSGPQAIAWDARGELLIFDNLKRQIVRLLPGGRLQPVLVDLPSDGDTFATWGDDLALRRALSLEVPVYSLQTGKQSGVVPVPEGAREAERVHLLPGGRVMLEHGYQLRYLLGSPNAPRQAEAVLAQPRDGAGEGFEPDGLQILLQQADGRPLDAQDEGRHAPALAPEGTHVGLWQVTPHKDPSAQGGAREMLLDLGKGDAGRVIGRRGRYACVLLESVDRTAEAMSVRRELLWIDLAQRVVLGREAAPVSSLYSPRQEFAFDGTRTAQALPTADGLVLRVINWKAEAAR